MKTLLAFILTLSVSLQSFAQILLAQAKPEGSDVWGYIDPRGNFVIEPQYTNCHAFAQNGLAAIYDKKTKKFYFINKENKKLETENTDFRLKNIFGFGTMGYLNDMALVEIGKKWGYLDRKGSLAIPAKYDDATEFNEGYAMAKVKDQWYIIDRSGVEKEIGSDIRDANHFQEGYAPIRVGDNYGFISTTGKITVEPKFKSVGFFVHGRAWAKTEDGKVGFIDNTGNWLVEPKFEAAKDATYSTSCARVKENDQWTFIDKRGNTINVAKADSYGDFEDGLAYAKVSGLVGFISPDGAWAIEPKFEAVRDFKNGFAAARQGDKWGFIDKAGNWVIEPKFDGVKDFENAGK